MEEELDMAEFTILTPFPCSPVREQYLEEGRIFNNNWLDYTCDKVVFQPKKMSPETLYKCTTMQGILLLQIQAQSQNELLFQKAVKSEMEKGTTGI
jgi:hypothetical protein